MENMIKFTPTDQDWVVFKYPGDSFMNRSKMIVSPGQRAVCVYLGKIEGEFKPGVSVLDNANYPFLGKFFQGKQPDRYPYEIYFINSTINTKTNWFTQKPAYVKDSETGLLVHVGAKGSYIFRLRDAQFLLQAVIGSLGDGDIVRFSYFQDQFDDAIQEAVQEAIGYLLIEKKIPALEVSYSTKELSKQVFQNAFDFFAKYGFEITDFNTSAINVFDEDLEAMKKKKEYDVLGTSHITERQLDISESWSKNEGKAGGMAASMMGLGIGLNAIGLNLGNISTQKSAGEEKNSNNSSSNGPKCPKCGANVPPNSKFCPECGSPMERHCSQCGAKISGSEKFCPQCGNKL